MNFTLITRDGTRPDERRENKGGRGRVASRSCHPLPPSTSNPSRSSDETSLINVNYLARKLLPAILNPARGVIREQGNSEWRPIIRPIRSDYPADISCIPMYHEFRRHINLNFCLQFFFPTVITPRNPLVGSRAPLRVLIRSLSLALTEDTEIRRWRTHYTS